ncbi:MAG: hypothetical protein ABJD07_16980 [Gemmatimonadaceae bacterium]
MIRIDGTRDLVQSERYALTLLVDLARAIEIDDPRADVVALRVADDMRADDLCDARWSPAIADGSVTLSRAALASVVAIAGAGDEQRAMRVDRFGRVPPSENPLVKRGLEREPVVSRAAGELRRAIAAAAGRRAVRFTAPWPDGKRWAAAFTHDLDVVSWWPLFTALRVAELARKREGRRVALVLAAAAASVARSPVRRAAASLLALEARLGITSTWFVLCGTPTMRSFRRGDLTYRPDGAARDIVREVRNGGHEIGLHGSFDTMDVDGTFARQRGCLATLGALAVGGVRQHFVRMRPGITHRAMREAGFTYDASYVFPDRNGFRLGVADVVAGWDDAAAAPSGIEEVPATWMDRALSKYRGVEDPVAWGDDAIALADACRAVEGCWVGIWHPNLDAALGFPDAPEALARAMTVLIERDPFVASLETIVNWRQARRGVRARAIGADGVVDAYASSSTPFAIALEDGTGRRAEAVRAAVRAIETGHDTT